MIAEGVQTQSELDTVAGIGVTHAQGHLLQPPADLTSLVALSSSARVSRREMKAGAAGRIAALATSGQSVADVAAGLLEVVLDVTGCEIAYITVATADGAGLEHRFVRRVGRVDLPAGLVVAYPDTLCSRMRDAGLTWTSDVPHDAPGCPLAEAAGIRTFVSIPFASGEGHVAGTLCAGSLDSLYISRTSLAYAELCAQVVGELSSG